MYNINDIAQITNGKFLNKEVFPSEIEHLLTDSRNPAFTKNTLFFALQGAQQNGHQYIGHAYQAGIRNFVVSEEVDISNLKGNFILVTDTLVALQKLARHRRKQFQLPVIGITGSNGKTIVKEWLGQLLAEDRPVVKSPKSYNSQIGVPLSVWQIKPQHEIGIFEAGISRVGEMINIAPVIDCEIGIFTNIGAAHSRGFKDDREKIFEKFLLFRNAKLVIYRSDDWRISEAFQKLKTDGFSWSTEKEADLQITHISSENKASEIIAIYKDEIIKLTVPFTDEAYLENCIHCWATLLYLGLAAEDIAKRFTRLQAVPLRLELKAAINDCLLINDSYNADFNSIQIALNFLGQQHHGPKILVLSDILQSSEKDQALYRSVANLLNQNKIDLLIGVGEKVKNIHPFLTKETKTNFYPSTLDFIEHFNAFNFKNATILLKGARRFEFERIASLLEKKAHRTVLEVNLSALSHNLKTYKKLLQPNTKIMVMVKASAYGSGSIEVARLLEFEKADYLTVAYTDEGTELRQAGIQLPIMVLNPEEAAFEAMIRHRLEPEIYSISLLEKFVRRLEREMPEAPYPIHLKLDTGMNRLGFEEQQLDALTAYLEKISHLVKIQSVFSHLAGSESSGHDEFTQQQIVSFEKMADQLVKNLNYKPIRHLLNSGGISRFPEHQFDMVRLGIGLYGIDSSGLLQDRLQVVSTLKATISQIKVLRPGETIGYGRAGLATTPMRIGTISIGYADGFSRKLSEGRGKVWIHGRLAPVIGKVCMDMTMIDLTGIPQSNEGDEVEIFGLHHSIQSFAEDLETIPYEVLTAISGRVKRVYFMD